jgi:hypothetical protein
LSEVAYSWTQVERVEKDHGVVDRKGRKLGHAACIFWTGRPVPAFPAGYFHVSVQATRDGHPFGACQRGHDFATHAEAQAHASAKLARTRPGKL